MSLLGHLFEICHYNSFLRCDILYVFDALGSTYRSLYFCMVQNALAASLLPFASTWAPHSFLLQPAYLSPSNLAGCSFDPIRHPQPRRRAYPPSTTLCPDSLAPPSVDSPGQDPRALGHRSRERRLLLPGRTWPPLAGSYLCILRAGHGIWEREPLHTILPKPIQ